ncbi:MAG: DUF5131 family protein [Planctomycetota bacterium]
MTSPINPKADEWWDLSWSPWFGCEKISPGCRHCYAAELAKRFPKTFGGWGRGRDIKRPKHWETPLAFDRRARKLGRPLTVFPSVCDPFEPRAGLVEVRADFFCRVVVETRHLIWLLLTKRPERIVAHVEHALDIDDGLPYELGTHGPLPNVWYGASVERADYLWRIAELKKVPAAGRFVSFSPLLGPVAERLTAGDLEGIDWVQIEGEQYTPHLDAAECRVEWVADLAALCADAGVPVFIKQLGSHVTYGGHRVAYRDGRGADPDDWPVGLRRRREYPVFRAAEAVS